MCNTGKTIPDYPIWKKVLYDRSVSLDNIYQLLGQAKIFYNDLPKKILLEAFGDINNADGENIDVVRKLVLASPIEIGAKSPDIKTVLNTARKKGLLPCTYDVPILLWLQHYTSFRIGEQITVMTEPYSSFGLKHCLPQVKRSIFFTPLVINRNFDSETIQNFDERFVWMLPD